MPPSAFTGRRWIPAQFVMPIDAFDTQAVADDVAVLVSLGDADPMPMRDPDAGRKPPPGDTYIARALAGLPAVLPQRRAGPPARLPIWVRLICCGREICSGGGQSISGSPAAEYNSSDNDSGMSTGNSSPLELSASCAPLIRASIRSASVDGGASARSVLQHKGCGGAHPSCCGWSRVRAGRPSRCHQ
jgi:hypothetical protein